MTFNALKASLVMAPQPTVMLNAHMMVLLWNKAAEDLFGWTSSETEGHLAPFLTPEGRLALSSLRKHPGENEVSPLRCFLKNGDEIVLPMAVLPVQGKDPEDIHSLCIVVEENNNDQQSDNYRAISRNRLIAAIPEPSQSDLRERLQFESLLSTISSDLIKTRGSNLSTVLQKTLNAVREFFAADQALLAYTPRQKNNDTQILTSSAEYMKSRNPSDIDPKPVSLIQYLQRTPFFRFSSRRELPPDWAGERALALKYGVSSGLWIRLRTRDRDVGFIALHQQDPGRSWTMDTAHRLQLFGEIMVGAMFRCHVERELAETKIFQETVLENLPIGIFAKKASDLSFVFMNRAALDLAGYNSISRIKGRSNEDLFTQEDAMEFTAQDRKVLQTLEPIEIDRQAYTSSSGGTKVIRTRKVPVFGEDDKVHYLVGIIEDLTHQVASSSENNHLKNKLLEIRQSEAIVNAARNFAHDFNNHIYGIIGYTDLIKDMTDDEETLKYLGQILVGAKRASNLLDRMQEVPLDEEAQTHQA